MKLLVLLMVAFSLSGCFYQTINQYDISESVRFCNGVENIAEVAADAFGTEISTCVDNRKLILHKK